MKYINANEILPVRLVEELQKYMQAGYIYIPAKTDDRNKKIISDYKQGITMENIAYFYHLSVYAIRKIIYRR